MQFIRQQRRFFIQVAFQEGCTIYLPAGAVDSLEPSADHLHGLIATESAQRRHKRLVLHQVPQFVGSNGGKRVLDLERPCSIEPPVKQHFTWKFLSLTLISSKQYGQVCSAAK